MQYLGLVYYDEKRWLAMPEPEKLKMFEECGAYRERLVAAGKFLGGSQLHASSTATTLRQNGEKLAMTDGPFAETKEVLGGFQLIECRDLDEALAVSREWPGLKWGLTLEVRPTLGGCGD